MAHAVAVFARDNGHLVGIDEEAVWFAVRATTPGMPCQSDYRLLKLMIKGDVLIYFKVNGDDAALDDGVIPKVENVDKANNKEGVRDTMAPSERNNISQDEFIQENKKESSRFNKTVLSGESFILDGD